MDYEAHLRSLQMQKAILSDEIQSDKGFTISVEQHKKLLMLGCVELQINITRKIINANYINDFDEKNGG